MSDQKHIWNKNVDQATRTVWVLFCHHPCTAVQQQVGLCHSEDWNMLKHQCVTMKHISSLIFLQLENKQTNKRSTAYSNLSGLFLRNHLGLFWGNPSLSDLQGRLWGKKVKTWSLLNSCYFAVWALYWSRAQVWYSSFWGFDLINFNLKRRNIKAETEKKCRKYIGWFTSCLHFTELWPYQIYYNGNLKMNTDVNVLQWLFKLSSLKTVPSFKGKVCEIME